MVRIQHQGKGIAIMQGSSETLWLTDKVAISGLNYARVAEAIVSTPSGDGRTRGLKDKFKRLSMSKLRGIYGLVTNVYTCVNTPSDLEESFSDLQYIKVKMAYESGRDSVVKDFISETRLMTLLDQIHSYDQFMLYCRYAESLVAYFKFYGGKE